jgi:hypothetical protein
MAPRVPANQPAPAWIGTDIPLVYFGPTPSSVQKELIGPHQLLTAGQVDTNAGTVTLALTTGFSFARSVLYLSTDANDPALAALEGATFAPAISDVAVGRNDGAFSAVERIFIFTKARAPRYLQPRFNCGYPRLTDPPARRLPDHPIGRTTKPSPALNPALTGEW